MNPAVMAVMNLLQVLGNSSAPTGLPMPPNSAGNSPAMTVSAAQLVDALLERLYRRVPKPGTKTTPAETCPFSDLNRSALYELFNLRNENGSPVIKTASLREEHEKRGARYYSVGSVLNYLDQLAAQQARECETKKHGKHS